MRGTVWDTEAEDKNGVQFHNESDSPLHGDPEPIGDSEESRIQNATLRPPARLISGLLTQLIKPLLR